MLTELLEKVQAKVVELASSHSELVSKVETLREELAAVSVKLTENEAALASAAKERDSIVEALKVAPEVSADSPERGIEDLRRKRQTVFLQMRQIPNVWIKPFGIAALTGLDVEEVCAILRRASKIEGIPLEHNGERGIGSMYRWVGEPIAKITT